MEPNYIAQARKVLQTEIDELIRLSGRIGSGFVNAIEALRQGLDGGGKIIVIGVGKSENIATKIAATFSSTGAIIVAFTSDWSFED